MLSQWGGGGAGDLAFGYIVPVKLSSKGLQSQCLKKVSGTACQKSHRGLELEAGGLEASREDRKELGESPAVSTSITAPFIWL